MSLLRFNIYTNHKHSYYNLILSLLKHLVNELSCHKPINIKRLHLDGKTQ
ncbi:hypothetical protein ERH_0327 [Erysipelothrix rhusiopathiae str. Fujisawa]|nr:hypothetical protein ERH_0327 [Erysipelothrix rhusiopathiae str. Fujisawa]